MRARGKSIIIASAVVSAAALAYFVFSNRTESGTTSSSRPDQTIRANSGSTSNTKPPPPAFTGLKEQIVSRVEDLNRSTTAEERLRLVNALCQLGPGAETKLGSALREVSSLTGKAVLADALARIGTSEAVDALLGVLASTNDTAARAEIVRSFDVLPPGQPLETLASSLVTSLDPQVRDGVIATIARAADANTVQFLTEMYHEPETISGQTDGILSALASIHNSGAVEPMKTLLTTNRELPVMEAAVHSLGKIGTPDALQAIASVLETIGSTNPALRQQMLATVQAAENPAALDWLQQTAAAKNDPDLASAASAALGAIKKQAAR